MNYKRFLKIMLRSFNYNAALQLTTQNKAKAKINIKSRKISLIFRTGTSDAHLIEKILIKPLYKCEYYIPNMKTPKMILDIGANIGVSTLFFKSIFPEAKIYAVEPFPENVDLLRENIKGIDGLTIIDKGLGEKDGYKIYYFSDTETNFGGGTFQKIGHNPEKKYNLEVMSFKTLINKYNIDKIDLIKIDTEGSEYEILTNIPSEVFNDVSYIVGELHGIKDFETLAFLSQWFDIGVKKDINKRLSNFYAINKKIKQQLN